MQAIAQNLRAEEPAHPQFTAVNTTLYDLIEAISNEVQPSEDRLVTEIVSDLFDRGLIRLSDSMGKSSKNFSLN